MCIPLDIKGVLMLPSMYPVDTDDTFWSKALEGVRKDVGYVLQHFERPLQDLQASPTLPKTKRHRPHLHVLHIAQDAALFRWMGVFESGVNWAGANGPHVLCAHDPVLDVKLFWKQGARAQGGQIDETAADTELKQLITHVAYAGTTTTSSG